MPRSWRPTASRHVRMLAGTGSPADSDDDLAIAHLQLVTLVLRRGVEQFDDCSIVESDAYRPSLGHGGGLNAPTEQPQQGRRAGNGIVVGHQLARGDRDPVVT